MTMNKKSLAEKQKHGAAGKRRHVAGLNAKLKAMSAAGGSATHLAVMAAYKVALRGK